MLHLDPTGEGAELQFGRDEGKPRVIAKVNLVDQQQCRCVAVVVEDAEWELMRFVDSLSAHRRVQDVRPRRSTSSESSPPSLKSVRPGPFPPHHRLTLLRFLLRHERVPDHSTYDPERQPTSLKVPLPQRRARRLRWRESQTRSLEREQDLERDHHDLRLSRVGVDGNWDADSRLPFEWIETPPLPWLFACEARQEDIAELVRRPGEGGRGDGAGRGQLGVGVRGRGGRGEYAEVAQACRRQ